MKVLIVGSTHFAGSNETKLLFQDACREIGKALAESDCDVIVGSDRPSTADRYVVEGVISARGKRKIYVFRPETEETPFVAEREAHAPRIEFIYHILKGEWAAGRVPQLRAADAVVLIGGGRGTEQVGYVAPILERPVLAIPSFGGGAADVWSTLEPFYKRLGTLREKLGNLQVKWQPSNAQLACEILTELRRKKLFVVEKVAPHVALLAAIIALLCFWVYLFIAPPVVPGVAFFAMLGVSAFLGTALRNALTIGFDPTADVTWRKVLNELSAGLLLAFGLAVIYLVGGFTVTGKFDFIATTSQPGDFQRIALSMTILGLAGGWLIELVAERIREWIGGRLPR